MNLLLRADGDSHIGTGHVMRGLALAQAAQDVGGLATFLTTSRLSALESRLRSEDFRVCHLAAQPGSLADAAETTRFALETKASCVIVDGYQFDSEYQRQIRNSGLPFLFVDDSGDAHNYCADFVLNQNIYAHEGLYSNRDPQTRLLLGTEYVLLRREFLRWRGKERPVCQKARRVLVTLGGGDEHNLTLRVLQAMQQLQLVDLQTVVVVGPANPHLDAIQREARLTGNVEIKTTVSDMPSMMAWADVAISSGGVTCYELVYMGVPTLVAVLAENQRAVAQGLSDAGVVINLGWREKLQAEEIAQAMMRLLSSAEERSSMVLRSRGLIDGNGAHRVLMRLNGNHLTLRRANESDCRMVWEWVNMPEVRAASFSSEEIPFSEHLLWYNAKIASPDCLFYIASNENGDSVGQVRFDTFGTEAVISIIVDSGFRGRGFGSRLIRLACCELLNTFEATLIHAYIKIENHASVRAFSRAGFCSAGKSVVREHEAAHMTLGREQFLGL